LEALVGQNDNSLAATSGSCSKAKLLTEVAPNDLFSPDVFKREILGKLSGLSDG